MPRRTDINKILVIGAGPIVIGQACEFDYSGSQACKVLKEEGFEVVLVNSNPATIMTDPGLADRTYVEPVTPEFVEKVIARERPDALLPTLGGQTGLNCAVALAESGVLEKYGVELIGAKLDAIKKGEDRKLFAEAMRRIGLKVPRSGYAYSIADAERIVTDIGLPVVIRPSFTMGGAGGGIAYNIDELREIVAGGVALSPASEVLVEESVLGWKEFEMEVMRDRNDNVVIVCCIENFDAMGVHTGDSITVAPAQTLTDREYQTMRDASIAIMREIGVETGGSNVQFAVNPADGELVVIEMNPRVSRSSALASKATGFPIAKFAAKLAVGYSLDEISNDITKETPASFEPSIDYTVVKVPRWAFEKFEGSDVRLTSKMKSVGEAMAIGRTFEEALGKAMRSLENGRYGMGADGKDSFDEHKFDYMLATPTEDRIYYVAEALRRGRTIEDVHHLTKIDPWFLRRIEAMVEVEREVASAGGVSVIDEPLMRNCIENFDAMGVHTGDSITVAPAQTLTDREYQTMRDASIAIMREIGVETGGSNVQFAVNPADGELVVIEMNPRVSRSSALASKATGFPIAKFAAKLAVGYSLDEISNDITKETPASFEPSIDYTVVKVPRWAFEKFEGSDVRLTSKMKSVGEAMAIGRTFEEALGKAMRSLENGRYGMGADGKDSFDEHKFDYMLATPTEDRIYYVAEALRRGRTIEDVHHLTKIDPWFLRRIEAMVEVEREVASAGGVSVIDEPLMRKAKQHGLGDAQIGWLTGQPEAEVRTRRLDLGVKATFKAVDTCAAEFAAYTPYFYKTYESEDETPKTSDRPKIMILGAGPNRIGQGIEFDYCCVHAAYAFSAEGYETIMVNCNPETVSTDYDTSDRLYFEPLTFEDVMDIVEVERPAGVLVTFGGQTPLKLAGALAEAGVPMIGTGPEAIDLAEDRKRFQQLLDELGIPYPAAGTARTHEEALEVARTIGFPLLVRPSYVLGGRGMVIAYSEAYMERYMHEATSISPNHPVLLDKFLEGAIEVDVDAVCDGEDVFIGGVMEHIEEAGIHSGDSACCIPPFSLSEEIVSLVRVHTKTLALALGVKGLINIQFAVKDSAVFVLEVNPRASRTVPFVSKATCVPLAKIAVQVMAGRKLSELDLPADANDLDRYCVKEAVMPFGRFPGSDSVLGPEMKSTGEVMGIAEDFPSAYAKSQLALDYSLPTSGKAFISVSDRDKRAVVSIARHLAALDFEILSTRGTARTLRAAGVPVIEVLKKHEGRPNIVDALVNDEIQLVVNTPFGQETRSDGYHIRTAAIQHGVTNITTIAGAQALVGAIEAATQDRLAVIALQDLKRSDA
ncbi:MAG: carbamoyl-phosphate synthase large subunit [Actinobacteria bacterium]|nr:carbamoyl-phosphate synthase large subunit [Actinomycetota bacterium]